MQTFRDAATVGLLILLGLTLRVDLGGDPVAIDLGSPVEAALETPHPRPSLGTFRPAPTPTSSATAPDTAPAVRARPAPGVERRVLILRADDGALATRPPRPTPSDGSAPCCGTPRNRLAC